MVLKALQPLLLAAFLLQCGCSSPKEIAEFASLAERAARDFAGVAQSVVTTCEVQQQRGASSRAAIFSLEEDGVALAKQDTERCASSVSARDALLDAHKVVEEYMMALKLLSNDNVLITKPADGSVDTLKKGLGLSEAQAASIKGLADAIAKALTDGYRRKELAKMIREANEPLQQTVAVLSGVIGQQIESKFKLSEAAVKSYYATGLAAQKDAGAESITSRLWIQQGERELAELRAQKAAALSYRKILAKIATGHAKLNEASGNWKSPVLASFLAQSIQEIRAEQQKVEKAFSK